MDMAVIYARSSSFFFSSRRRHTRSKRDWSSDVCSSDLRLRLERRNLRFGCSDLDVARAGAQVATTESQIPALQTQATAAAHRQIGRASCRERVWTSGLYTSVEGTSTEVGRGATNE